MDGVDVPSVEVGFENRESDESARRGEQTDAESGLTALRKSSYHLTRQFTCHWTPPDVGGDCNRVPSPRHCMPHGKAGIVLGIHTFGDYLPGRRNAFPEKPWSTELPPSSRKRAERRRRSPWRMAWS